MWIALFPLLLSPAPPQEPVSFPDPLEHFETRESALALAREGESAAATPLLQTITRATPYDGEAWLALGRSHHRLGSYADAIAAYERALELGFGYASTVHYDIARCRAALGDTDAAFAALDRSLASRLENRLDMADDRQLASLREDPRWSETAGLPVGDMDPAAGWRLDLLHLEKEIARLHVDVGQAAPRDEIAAAVEALYERIPELPEHRIPVQMQRIVRRLGDGHSVVYPVSRRVRPTILPFRLYWFPEGIHVIDARAGFEEWIGHRVVSIGSGAVEDFADDLRELVARDNEMSILWMGPFYLLMPAVLHDLGYVDSIERIPLVLADADGGEHELVVEPVPLEIFHQRLVPAANAPETPLYLTRVQEHYWLELLDDGVLYVQFNQVLDGPGETLAEFAVRVRAAVTANEIDQLIVDVRHNNGGTSYLSRELVRSLIHFETTRENGRLDVLMGRNTFSAAQFFVTDVDRWTDALFVGEPSGSRPNVVSEETEVILPFSGTMASISCRYFQQSWPGDDRVWIVPDIPVMLTFADYQAGRDRALEAVLELGR